MRWGFLGVIHLLLLRNLLLTPMRSATVSFLWQTLLVVVPSQDFPVGCWLQRHGVPFRHFRGDVDRPRFCCKIPFGVEGTKRDVLGPVPDVWRGGFGVLLLLNVFPHGPKRLVTFFASFLVLFFPCMLRLLTLSLHLLLLV